MGKVNFFIDGIALSGDENEPILNAARAEGIFIPAICYLNRCSASLACRLCLVEVDGKQVFSCNAKPKEGMQVITNSDEIKTERRSIMEVYDINHPLECGVCDKSGSCELQNYTLEMGVDSQNQKITDCHRPIKDWGLVKYDASLCIVCERCVTVCKDMVGDNALTTVPRGGVEIDKEFKEIMPKNSYTIWNKMNKSIIGAKAGESLDCTYCGECIAVCPVGALTSPDFTYKSNSWELEKIPSSCAHCSLACYLEYEVKHTAIENNTSKIYRVTNEWNFQSLCGAGRFGFDYQNSGTKDKNAFLGAVEAFKNAKTIKFNSYITNEEALMLQTLKERNGIRLVNSDAFAYSRFLSSYKKTRGKTLYTADTKTVHDANFVVSIGSNLKSDAPIMRFAMNNALSMNKGGGLYFHPVYDSVVGSMNKNLLALTNKPGSEEGVMWLLLGLFADRSKLPSEYASYLESKDYTYKKTVTEKVKKKIEETITEQIPDENGVLQDVEKTVTKEIEESVSKEIDVRSTYLLDCIGIEADAAEKIEALFAKKDRQVLILGSDLYNHPRASQIASLAALLELCSDFKVVIIPSSTNTLGVSLICDLDEYSDGYTVGYNESGDFVLSSTSELSGENTLAMPALNQQEGTFVSCDKRVTPINAAISFDGYELNDIMNALGLGEAHTIDWSKKLPTTSGFKNIDFDSLPNSFANNGEKNIGYILNNQEVQCLAPSFLQPNEGCVVCGTIAYASNPVLQFNDFTAKCSQLESEPNVLECSSYFAQGHGLQSGDKVMLDISGSNADFTVSVNQKLVGSIILVPTYSSSSQAKAAFAGKYAFQSVNLTKGN